MAPEVGKHAKCAAGTFVVILYGSGNDAARYPLSCAINRFHVLSGVRGIEMDNVCIYIGVPVRCEVVGKFQVSSVLFKTHIGTVVVGTAVLPSHHRRELALSDGVRRLAGDGAVGAGANSDVGTHTVLQHLPRHYVYHSSHSIAAIDYRGWSAEHFYAFRHKCLVAVADRMSIDAVILRMSVDEYKQLSCSAADAAHVYTSGSTR